MSGAITISWTNEAGTARQWQFRPPPAHPQGIDALLQAFFDQSPQAEAIFKLIIDARYQEEREQTVELEKAVASEDYHLAARIQKGELVNPPDAPQMATINL